MAGRLNGLQALLIKDFPTAVFVHCFTHCVNLVVKDATELREVDHLVGTLKAVGNFFRQRKWNAVLQKCLLSRRGPQTVKIPSLTRWTDFSKINSEFIILYDVIVASLDIIIQDKRNDASARENARNLRETILDFKLSLTSFVS